MRQYSCLHDFTASQFDSAGVSQSVSFAIKLSLRSSTMSCGPAPLPAHLPAVKTSSSIASPPSSTSMTSASVCAICHAVGASLHYGVLTCSACMNFFRRTVTENLQYRCQEAGSCELSGPENRTKCRQCRWTRCLLAGMRPEGVSGAMTAGQMLPPPPPGPPISLTATSTEHLIQQQQQRQAQYRASSARCPPSISPFVSLQSAQQQQQQQRSDQLLYSNPYLYHLSNIDIRMLQLNFSGRPRAAASGSAPQNRDVDAWLCLIESFVGELIRWCKDLSGFSSLRAADQSALIRANGTKLLCFQVICNSLPYQGCLIFCSNLSLQQVNTNFCSRRLFKKLISLCQYATDLRLAYSELLLLRPIFLLDPPQHLQWAGIAQIRELQNGFLSQLVKVCPCSSRREDLFRFHRELADCWKLILEHLEQMLASSGCSSNQ